MKARTFILLGLIVSLTLVLTAAVTAKEPPDDSILEEPALSSSAPLGVNSVEGVRAPAVPLGQPGLSFRYVQTFGTSEQAYPADTQHLNGPGGLFIDGSDNLYVVEELGARMLEFDSTGSNVLSIGIAGMHNRGEYSFDNPRDVTVDHNGNVWTVDSYRVAQYDASGNFLQESPPDDPWNSGSDDTHFNIPRGIAFDSGGRLYVSDTENHRIQVYTFTVEGTVVYSTTIGETGVSGSDNSHFNQPYRIAIDGSDNLYVADAGNHRLQIFSSSHAYVATIGVAGESGSDNGHFNWPTGVHVDASKIYVADRENWRVQIFDRTTRAYQSTLGTDWGWNDDQFAGPLDVATDSASNIYVADEVNHRVQKFNSSGVYVSTIGVTRVPYLTDGYHYNHPRVAIDNSGNIIILEEDGQRLVKLNASGVFQWSAGEPGVHGDDNEHFGWPHGVAVDKDGRIYVVDGNGNHRVQIYASDGAYSATLGTGQGTGNYQFDWPAGIAVGDNGYIYVSDANNHRVQIYNGNRVFVGRIGVTGECGSDNDHLCSPIGIEVDAAGNIYVADAGNARVQKFDSSRQWQMTLGTTGSWGEDFSQFSSPEDIAIDAQGRIYVADIWNQRVQVFDHSGNYLTTIGGAWGSNSGQLRNASGVDLDSAGNVYVTDFQNGRIQKFAPGVPGWRQMNINGFGDRSNWAVSRMSVFGNYLYASAVNDATGGEVWRTATGTDWSQVNQDGFGSVSNLGVLVGEAWNGYLYAGTENSDTGAEIWRCQTCNGTDWTQVVSGGFDDSNNTTVERVVVFSNTLYATTDNGVTGVEVWKSSTGAPGSWAQCNEDGFGDNKNTGLWSVAVLDGYLYAATDQWGEALETGTHTGVEVWRTRDGTTWSQVNTDGFGDPDYFASWMESFNGYLYVLSTNVMDTGAQFRRCATCDGTDWAPVVGDIFDDSNNAGGAFMLGSGNYFYVCMSNGATGTEVWRTANGTSWSQMNVDGFGDSNNVDVWSGAVFKDRLFLGTRNDAGWRQTVNGGEVWQFVGYPIYLPLVVRNR